MLLLLPHPFTTSVPVDFSSYVKDLDGVIGESPKEVLRLFKAFGAKKGLQSTPYALLNEHTKEDEIPFLAEPILKGENWGLMSDAGLPSLADPGSKLVLYLKLKGIEVKAIPAASPIFYCLLLSGLPSQRFQFHGYPPRGEALNSFIRQIEKKSLEEKSTQYFITPPYRNQATFLSILDNLKDTTLLSLAVNVLNPKESVITQTVRKWKKGETLLEEDPTTYLIFSGKV